MAREPQYKQGTAGKLAPRAGPVLRAARGAALLLMLLVLAVGGLIAYGASGFGRGQIEAAAQQALSQFVGTDVTARFGEARLVLDGINLVALELQDVHLGTGADRQQQVAADRLRFSVALWPLLHGRILLTGAQLDDVEILLDGSSGGESLAGIRNARGLIEPDLVARELLAASDRIFSAFTGRPGVEMRLTDLFIDPLPDQVGDEITLALAKITKRQGRIEIMLEGDALDSEFRARAEIVRDDAHEHGTAFEAEIEVPDIAVDFGTDRRGRDRGNFSAAARLAVAARRSLDGRAEVQVDLVVDEALLAVREGSLENGTYQLNARLMEGAGKIEFDNVSAAIGRNLLKFHGAFGPAPETMGADPAYRYELVSDGSHLAPADSPEPTLSVLARIAGIINPAEGRITADEIGVRTTHGSVIGNGALVFPGNVTPAAFLAISASDFPVSQAKQLWPWISAEGARKWVLGNVFGGVLRSARINLSTAPGRLGSGIPLTGEEVSGHFEIKNARFNLAGELPPVRDAIGTVDFEGRKVRIGLDAGTVFMESGRTVDGSNGTLAIDVVRGEPLVGALELDVAGSADAITELAAFEPIDALRFIDLQPADFSGKASGHVSGTIPLQKKVERDLIDWDVHLDYEGLDIARPFNGQMLTEATGSIHIDRERAVIEARGRLNGLPAELSLMEPLDRSLAGRRDIKVELDDAARERLMPGLGAMVSGPVSVEVVQARDGAQEVRADLTRATLRFPWVGWRKGSGVAARMGFTLRQAEKSRHIEGLSIRGDGFAIEGSATLAGGVITEADFPLVQLNRGDLFHLAMFRQQGGYRLDVTGQRIDVRSLVKQVLSDSGSGSGGNAAPAGVPIRLNARSEILVGFGGEELRNVAVSYFGTGDVISGLSLSATTRNGQGFNVRLEEAEGLRNVQMQSADAGSILRFLDIYPHMAGGTIDLRLSGRSGGPLTGQIDARNFLLVNEPRLKSLVASAPGGSPSLNDATQGRIETTRASFEHGFARIEKGSEYLAISEGVLRGPEIGSTFQGMLYDADGQISLTGTFMPAYGLNRIFAEIPFFGLFLGNGNDRGLIGITYKLSGNAKAPQLTINPISAIAPGVFRNIFQFH